MKPTQYIRPVQAREILRAGRHAWKIERDLNTYVVINFDRSEGDELRAQREFKAIRTKCRSWLYYKRQSHFMDPLTDIRTWEMASGILHVNWALHVPAHYQDEFHEKLPGWIDKALGGIPVGCYRTEDIYNLNGLMRYMLKGVQPSKAHRFGIKAAPQGDVWGRRAAASTCLGRAARARDIENGVLVRGL